jgi:hypothetical protein
MAKWGAAKLKERDGMKEEGDYVEAFYVCEVLVNRVKGSTKNQFK